LLNGEGGEQSATFQLLYDNTNSLAGYIDPAGNRHEQVRDLKGRVLTVTNPNIGSVNYTYDAAGNITHIEDARGAIERRAYDGLNRKVERWDEADREGTLATLAYDFDPSCAVTECTNTPGVLATATYTIALGDGWTSQVTERAGYDVRGQQIFAARDFGGLTDLVTRMAYDNAGRLTSVTHPDGTIIENSYDKAGRVMAMPGYVTSASYEERGLLEALTFVNGATMEIGYDALQRFDTIRSKDGGGQDIEGWDYTRDRVGNILNIGDLGTRAARPSTAADFVYDDWYRVGTSQLSVGTVNEEILSYTYDTLDNVLSATSSLGEESRGHIGAYVYDDRPNMATEAGELKMAYDAAGHMTTNGDAQMAWDYMGRLTGTTRADGKGAAYAYGVDEGRVAKVEDGSLTLYGYNDFKVRDGVAVSYARLKRQFVARHETPGFAGSFYPDADGDGTITAGDAYASSSDSAVPMRSVLMASAARALAEGEDAKAFFHSDHLGSITAATDEGGDVRGQRAYYPFGDVRWEEGFVDEYGFTGQELDQLTGLLHFQFRYLDPRVGRWVSFDPLFVRLEQETIEKYAEFNGYAYVSNNPLNSVDPLGLCKGENCPKKKGKSKKNESSSSSKGSSSSSSEGAEKTSKGGGKSGKETTKDSLSTDQKISQKANELTQEGNQESKRTNKASEKIGKKANDLTTEANIETARANKKSEKLGAKANKLSEEANKQAKKANEIAKVGNIISGITSAISGLALPITLLFGTNLLGTGN
ncbi:MAG: RHS repeat-associated core domain-containing protein, partial [Myxococcota bacterium]|nr:RHS repeat-associated core domain-containing protein [Myxococcota bacterium]